MATYFGFNSPFVGGPSGVMSRQEDERLIKNDLLQLLTTSPGERVFRSDFGTMVQSALFEPMDDVLIAEIRNDVYDKIGQFEPRVTVRDVSVSVNGDKSLLTLSVSVSPKYDPLTNYLIELNLQLPG